MITFTYPGYLPAAILLASALLTLGWQAVSRVAPRRARCELVRVGGRVRPGTILGIAIAVYGVTFSTLLVLKERAFGTYGFDLGIFQQATWLLSQGLAPLVTLRGLHAFGDHTSFVLVLLAPFYRVFTTPDTLFVIESAAMGLGAVPLYWLARQRLHGRWLPLFVPLLYLLYPSNEYVNTHEFHPEALAIPLVLFAAYFGLQGNTALLALFAGLAALCKEDIALTICALGVYLAWRGRVRIGLATGAVGLAWLGLCLGVILPYFNPAGAVYGSLYLDAPAGSDVATTLLRRLLQPMNLEYLVLLLVPFGGVSLLAPPALLIGLPAVLVNLLNVRDSIHTIFYHYTAMVGPWVALSAIEGLRRLVVPSCVGRPAPADPPRPEHPAGLSAHHFARLREPASLATYVLAAGLLSHFFFSPSPLSLQFIRDKPTIRPDYEHRASLPESYRPIDHDAFARQALGLIPPTAAVAAQSLYTPHLADRERVYQLPLPFENGLHDDQLTPLWGTSSRSVPEAGVDYVLLDLKASPWPAKRLQLTALADRLRGDPAYRLELNRDGVMLFYCQSARVSNTR